MMANILWSDIAKEDYWSNIDYLLDKWTEKEAAAFIELVDNTLRLIGQNPVMFAKTGYKNIRSVVIMPQITLFYNILDKNTIELVRFWNNRQDPKRLKLK